VQYRSFYKLSVSVIKMEGKRQTRQTAVQWSRVNHRHNILHFTTFKYDNRTSCTSSVLAVLAYLSNNNWHLNPSKGDGQKIGRLCPLFSGGGAGLTARKG